MTPNYRKIGYSATCVQWNETNTSEVLELLNTETIYALPYGTNSIMVRFSNPLPDQKMIDTIKQGHWVVVGENGSVKCYDDTTFHVKYRAIKELSALSVETNGKCTCTMAISMLGEGCRYCQPQPYIDTLHDMIDDYKNP